MRIEVGHRLKSEDYSKDVRCEVEESRVVSLSMGDTEWVAAEVLGSYDSGKVYL